MPDHLSLEARAALAEAHPNLRDTSLRGLIDYAACCGGGRGYAYCEGGPPAGFVYGADTGERHDTPETAIAAWLLARAGYVQRDGGWVKA